MMLAAMMLLTLTPLTSNAQCVQLMGLPEVPSISRDQISYDELELKTIPVVFHVLYTAPENNVSDQQLLAALSDANDGFASIGEPFEGYLETNAKIEFCLAQGDPDGQPTSGINRYDMTWNSDFLEGGMSTGMGNAGASDASVKSPISWDVDNYCNIYVVPEINDNDGGFGVQGYSYVGFTGDTRDGPVVLYNVLGEGTVKDGYADSKVLIHELGHWLRLYHTFNSTSGCATTGNCETTGDYVCDTPHAISGGSCINTTCGNPAMNYMDYIPNQCRHDFTEGQIERMHEGLSNQRFSLWNGPSPCAPVNEYDVAITAVNYNEAWCRPLQDVTVSLSDVGSTPLVGVTVSLSGAWFSQVQTLALVGATSQVVFSDVPAGTYTVTLAHPLDQSASNNMEVITLGAGEGQPFDLVIDHNVWSGERDWFIHEQGGDLMYSGGGYEFNSDTTVVSGCLAPGCYDLRLTDTAHDGFVFFGSLFDGNFTLFGPQGEQLAYVGEVSFSDTTVQFCIDAPPICLGDFNGDGVVGVIDHLMLLSAMGGPGIDLNGDGVCDIDDLTIFLGEWGGICGSGDLTLSSVEELEQAFMARAGKTYDITGREVRRITTDGIYIVYDDRGYAKKTFLTCVR